MYDRPTAQELLAAACQHIEQELLPLAKNTNFKLYFQSLVALNVLRIVERELQYRSTHLQAEWSRLNMLLSGEAAPSSESALIERLAQRNQSLCEQIRAGAFDTNRALFEHLKASSIEQLQVANPKFLQALAQEQ